jgi:hypothetical protein
MELTLGDWVVTGGECEYGGCDVEGSAPRMDDMEKPVLDRGADPKPGSSRPAAKEGGGGGPRLAA